MAQSRGRSRSRDKDREERVHEKEEELRQLIDSVIKVSQDVILARRAIELGGVGEERCMGNMLEAEGKLRNLIDLEMRLANELSNFRNSDMLANEESRLSVLNAEEKIRQLIDVESRLAEGFVAERKSSVKSKIDDASKSTLQQSPGTRMSDAMGSVDGAVRQFVYEEMAMQQSRAVPQSSAPEARRIPRQPVQRTRRELSPRKTFDDDADGPTRRRLSGRQLAERWASRGDDDRDEGNDRQRTGRSGSKSRVRDSSTARKGRYAVARALTVLLLLMLLFFL